MVSGEATTRPKITNLRQHVAKRRLGQEAPVALDATAAVAERPERLDVQGRVVLFVVEERLPDQEEAPDAAVLRNDAVEQRLRGDHRRVCAAGVLEESEW